jgi:hypothetical protein
MALALALAGCAPEPDQQAPPGLVLECDGLRIWEHEIEPLLAYVHSVDRRTGRLSAVTGILDGHLIPLKLAERAFPEQRNQQRELAAGLRAVIGNGGYPELVARGRAMGRDPCREVMRHQLPAAIAAWAFDPEHVGEVSPVIEVPQGFTLVSTFEVEQNTTRVTDRAETCQIAFYTHDAAEFGRWYEAQKARLAHAVTYLAPDYEGALPPWMEPPHTPKNEKP